MSDALVLTDVTKRYGGFTAVDRFSLRVPAGIVLGFLGPNGAGKTTTIRMVMNILIPDEGAIDVLGHPHASEIKDRIGYLPEERGLYRKMTVEQVLHYLGQLKGVPAHVRQERIAAALERVGLADWRRKSVESLSKGMQQKLQFVATVLHDPELVILDEPFSGLDPLNRELLESLMIDLKRRGRTVIFSTHQMEQAERLCDRIVLINRGRKLIDGSLPEVRGRFASRMVTLAGAADFSPLARAPGVAAAQFTAGGARLELGSGADPDALLRRALDCGRLTRFEVHSPDLQEIFIKLVGQDGSEPAAAPPAPAASLDPAGAGASG